MQKYLQKYFLNKIYGSNFMKQHSGTVMVLNEQNADCSIKNKFTVLFTIIFGTPSFPISVASMKRLFHQRHLENNYFISTKGPGFKPQSRRKLFTPIVPLFTKQQNW